MNIFICLIDWPHGFKLFPQECQGRLGDSPDDPATWSWPLV